MSSDKTTVLIVEDEPEFRLRFKQIVESEPTLELVGVAASKREAQELIDQTRFDVMLIDLGLPDGNGTDLIRQVSTKRPDVDIMVVTVFGEAAAVSAIEAGAAAILKLDRRRCGSCIRLRAASPVSPWCRRVARIRNRMGGRLTRSGGGMGTIAVGEAGYQLLAGRKLQRIGEISLAAQSPHRRSQAWRCLGGEAVASQMGLLPGWSFRYLTCAVTCWRRCRQPDSALLATVLRSVDWF
jgi:CheY-like chemotaxis protein